ncbi:DUF4222 domain-containing protein [Serratia sp. JSRIV002]|uniref:DUF4222 domain-containing protein n=1 Tax=Serratia sp. JSRIV002 TaxID=2831894 RepID=UPI001CBDCA68|nr:DUF4222 domain-containing protein [Serratia sp. JSRIV002]UAN52194.1 DUF4222 domain-containing protein [Serratia sp. JSRIV002]UAN52893.1 DUF4222 domain-containing protein [Serratia sp. JSRIV002]
MTTLAIQAESYYRDNNHVVVFVHEVDQENQTVTYSPVGYSWEITTAMIIFRSRFIGFSL